MVGGVDLEALLKVAADVDDLRSRALWEEVADDVDAAGLTGGHDDVGDE